MPLDIRCNGCSTKLRIPDELVGKKVRCRRCQSVLLALEEAPLEEAELPPRTSAPQSVETEEKPAERADLDFDSRRRRWAYDDEDDEDQEDEYEASRQPRSRRRRRKSIALELLWLPGIGLALVGFLGAIGHIVLVVLNVILSLPALRGEATQNQPPGNQGPFVMGFIAGTCIHLAVTFAWSGFVLKGAYSMFFRRNYTMAITGCIVAMVPCNVAWILGLPIGICGLIMLKAKGVKSRFD
jgi:hypothetical protein